MTNQECITGLRPKKSPRHVGTLASLVSSSRATKGEKGIKVIEQTRRLSVMSYKRAGAQDIASGYVYIETSITDHLHAAFRLPPSVFSRNGSRPASSLATAERADQSSWLAPSSCALNRLCFALSIVGIGVGWPMSSPKERICPASESA